MDSENLHVPIFLTEDKASNRGYLDLLGQPAASKGNPAAEWRLRKQRQYAIDERLHKMGPLAALSGSSLLVLLRGNQVPKLERSSNWRTTLEESPLFSVLNPVQQGQLKGARYGAYTRVEQSIQLLGEMICLTVKDLREGRALLAFNEFKIRCSSYAFASERTNDEVVEKIKWLGKLCQAIFLGIQLPEEPEGNFSLWRGDILLPFDGETAHISEIARLGRRVSRMTLKSATQLAQTGNLPRSLPYPSKAQVIDSVKETIKIVETPTTTNVEAKRHYRRGLDAMRATIPRLPHKRTHVSLLGSGTVEKSRVEGGRARHLVAHARAFTDKPLTEFEGLIGRYDQFGLEILNKTTYDIAVNYSQQKGWIPNLGTLAYVPGYEAEECIRRYFEEGRKIPKYLGHILNLTASKLIMAVGRYEPVPEIINGVLSFTEKKTKFKLEKPLYVKADISVESGMKSRMTTSALAAFAHLSQLPSNYMREYLSQDPFHRVGFEESDKLWEVLKYYRKRYASNQDS
jgi:hypothetical protein